jgi:hypothetical protein
MHYLWIYRRVGCKSVFIQEVTMSWGMSCRYESNFHCSVFIRIYYRYSSVINLGIYPLTHQRWKKSKTWFFWLSVFFLKFKKLPSSPLVLSWELLVLWCFWNHKNHWYSNSDFFSQKIRTSGSLILKFLENQNAQLFKKSDNHPTLVTSWASKHERHMDSLLFLWFVYPCGWDVKYFLSLQIGCW